MDWIIRHTVSETPRALGEITHSAVRNSTDTTSMARYENPTGTKDTLTISTLYCERNSRTRQQTPSFLKQQS